MKKMLRYTLLIGLVTLSSCGFEDYLSEFYEESDESSSSEVQSSVDSSVIGNNQGYYIPSSVSVTNADYSDRNSAETFALNTTGIAKLLVLPVDFSDYRCGAIVADNCSSEIDRIEKAFVGESVDNGWESVESFYEKSSYGALDLQITVAPFFYSHPMTANNFAAQTRNSGTNYEYFDPTWDMVDRAVANYKTLTGNQLADFDLNKDGFIDAVYMIYYNPNYSNDTSDRYTTKADDVFWAYAYWNYGNFYSDSLTSPKPMTYVWSSRDFMDEGYPGKIDSHTYIHEVGHALGLDDYYTYDDEDYGPLGGLDMMDFNVGDHNSYSKFFMGWNMPKVVNSSHSSSVAIGESFTVELEPFQDNGDFLLIKNNWNGSAFDEYLAVEYYTPTGLNYSDSRYPYANGAQMFDTAGVRILHVDSRLGKYDYSGNFSGYTNTVNFSTDHYPYIAHSNTKSKSQNENYRLIRLIDSSGVDIYKQGNVADNDSLFKVGDSFKPSTFGSFFTGGKFNNSSSIGYEISVQSMNSEKVILNIKRVA
jgi:M6 family metalloprotease-like protein